MSNRPADSNALEVKESAPTGVNAVFMAGVRPADAADPAALMPGKRGLGVQHALVLLVLAASGALLLGMRQFGMNRGLSFKVEKVEYVRDEAQERRSRDFIRELSELDRQGAAVQVPAERIWKNPFSLTAAPREPRPEDPKVDPSRLAAEQARREQEARKAALESEFGQFKLFSVMQGRFPLARIGSKNFRVGDTVSENFTVSAIREREVVLTADGQEFTLRMTEPGDGEKPAPRKPAKN